MKRKLIKPVPHLTLGQEYTVSGSIVDPATGNTFFYIQGHWLGAEFFSLPSPIFPYILRDLLSQANQVARHVGKRAKWSATQTNWFFRKGKGRWQGKIYLDRYFKEEDRLISLYGTKESSNVNSPNK